jgi:hypothetical protein
LAHAFPGNEALRTMAFFLAGPEKSSPTSFQQPVRLAGG